MGKFVSQGPCSDCTSSDACATYEDGSKWCFKCHTYTHADGKTETRMPTETDINLIEQSDEALAILDRSRPATLSHQGLAPKTLAYYGVREEGAGDGLTWYYPYYAGNVLVAAKRHRIKDKVFANVGNQKQADMFGMHLFQKGGRFLTIAEGERDAMAAWEMMDGKGACISPRNGTGSWLTDAKNNYEWIDSFETIVLVPDADEAGRSAATKVAELFAPGKVKIVKLAEGRDARDYLKHGKKALFNKKWWGAEVYSPAGIINGATLYDRLLNRPRPECFDYPWVGLNKMTYGMRNSEMVTIIAGSGMGKTQVCREIIFNRLKTTDHKIGCFLLEETVEDSGLGLMSLAADKLLHLPDAEYTTDEFRKAFDETLATGRVEFYDVFGSVNVDELVAKVRYFGKGLGCRLIVLDHISIVVSDQRNADERRSLDEIATKLKTVCMELDMQLLLVSHTKRVTSKPHEEGGATSLADIRGTAGIGQLSNIVLGLERDGQSDDLRVRNTTCLRVLKNRFTGKTGPACYLYFDDKTGRLSEEDDPAAELEEEIAAAADATPEDL